MVNKWEGLQTLSFPIVFPLFRNAAFLGGSLGDGPEKRELAGRTISDRNSAECARTDWSRGKLFQLARNNTYTHQLAPPGF